MNPQVPDGTTWTDSVGIVWTSNGSGIYLSLGLFSGTLTATQVVF